MEIWCNPAIPLLGIYPKNIIQTIIQKDFVAALSMIIQKSGNYLRTQQEVTQRNSGICTQWYPMQELKRGNSVLGGKMNL